jgi:heme/copper-type cytochrome/quinol oxidase subunit 4
MKNTVIAIFAIVIFLVGLWATGLEFIALIDPEGGETTLHYIFVTTAIVSFVLSSSLWKLATKNEDAEKRFP